MYPAATTAARTPRLRGWPRVSSRPSMAPTEAATRMKVISQVPAGLRPNAWAAQFSGTAFQDHKSDRNRRAQAEAEGPVAARIELDRQVGLALLGFVGDLLGLVCAPGQLLQVYPRPQQFPDLLGDLGALLEQPHDRGRGAVRQRGVGQNFRLPGSPVTGRVGLGVVSYRFDGHLCLLRHGVTGHKAACGQT